MDDAPFDVIMQQAVKLKTEQMAPNRRKYDAAPMWYQHSLFSIDSIIKVRETLANDFPALYQYAVDLKDIGNLEYKEGNMLGALNEYEKALSLFKWLRPLREDWKKRALNDSEMEQCAYQPKSELEKQKIATLTCQCLVNIAMCTQQTKEWAVSIRACDTVLSEIDYKCAKALYRRAQARSIPLSCGAAENYVALKDMKYALRYLYEQKEGLIEVNAVGIGNDSDSNDTNGVRVINSNALVTDIPALYNRVLADYKELSMQLQDMNRKDKKRNTKLFKSGTAGGGTSSSTTASATHASSGAASSAVGGIYCTACDESESVDSRVQSIEDYNREKEEESERENDTRNSVDSSSISNSSSIRPPGSSRQGSSSGFTTGSSKSLDDLTLDDFEVQMRDMEAAAGRYESDRQHAKARELRSKVAKMRRIIQEHAQKTSTGANASISPAVQQLPDFANPTPQMVEEARRLHGLDLTDPRVKEMLTGLQKEHSGTGSGRSSYSSSSSSSSTGKSTSGNGTQLKSTLNSSKAMESPNTESLTRALRSAEYKRIATKFLEDYKSTEALRPLLYNRYYNGLAARFRLTPPACIAEGKEDNENVDHDNGGDGSSYSDYAVRLEDFSKATGTDMDSFEALHTYCVNALTADWHYLAAHPPPVAVVATSNKGKDKEGKRNRAQDTNAHSSSDAEEQVMSGEQLETVLMLYLPAPTLTVEMFADALAANCSIHKDHSAYLQHLLKRQLLTTLASGTTPYWIGLIISILLMFLYNTFVRSPGSADSQQQQQQQQQQGRTYNPAVDVLGYDLDNSAYDSL